MKKNLSFFQRQKLSLKRQKLDASGYFCQQNTANAQAFFGVELQIAKYKKPHTMGETLIKALRFEYGEVNFEHGEVDFERYKRKENSASVII